MQSIEDLPFGLGLLLLWVLSIRFSLAPYIVGMYLVGLERYLVVERSVGDRRSLCVEGGVALGRYLLGRE